MACSDAGGMRKEEEEEPGASLVSMTLPCCTENVCSCASTVLVTTVHATMGSTARRVLVCCTSAAVHSRHSLSGTVSAASLMHALSKNLPKF